MKPGLTEIVAIVDRSGSMTNIAKDMEGGYTTFVRSQLGLPGECRVTLVTFDDVSIDTIYENAPASLATAMSLIPRGGTPLLDAVGRTIVRVGERYARTEWSSRPERVLVVIITDGAENSSREYTRQRVRDMITHQHEVYKWEFVYLGANVNAFEEARGLGIRVMSAAAYTPTAAGTADMFMVLDSVSTSYRSGGDATFDTAARQILES